MSEHRVRTGGLMRCCIETVVQHAQLGTPPKEGDTLTCRSCQEPLRYRDGAWEWANGDAEA